MTMGTGDVEELARDIIPVTDPHLRCSVCDGKVTGLDKHTGFPEPCGHVAGTVTD